MRYTLQVDRPYEGIIHHEFDTLKELVKWAKSNGYSISDCTAFETPSYIDLYELWDHDPS